MTKWIDITKELTKEGQKKIPIGTYLRFEKLDLKVVRKRAGKVWAKRVFLYKPDEVYIKDKLSDQEESLTAHLTAKNNKK